MDDFVLFFISIIIIILFIKKIFMNNDLIQIKSEKDGITYIVRDLPNVNEAINKLSTLNQNIKLLIDNLDDTKESVIRLKKNYNPRSLTENSKHSKHTSYSLNKGERISLCLREKNNEMVFEDDNTIMFVIIHELAHIMTTSIGHTKEFWDNMKYLLEEANKLGLYKIIDYSNNNIEYCGMYIKSTPYDFKK